MIEFRNIPVSQLIPLVESAEYAKWRFVPISRQRAESHAHNPRARPEDIALILALDEGELVGYLGLLPDHFFGDQGVVRGAWFSTLWIDPQQRGRGLAKQLLQRAFEAWNNHVAVTRFTKEAAQLYLRSERFVWPEVQTGMRGYLRMNLRRLLPGRHPETRHIKALLAVIDVVANAFIDIRLDLWLLLRRKAGRCEYTGTIDENMTSLIRQGPAVLRRDGPELTWIMKYPWLHEGQKDARYHFSSADRMFKMTFLCIYDNTDTLLGYAMLNIRNRNVQVPYHFFAGDTCKSLARAIGREMVRNRWSTITTIDNQLAAAMRKSAPFWLRRNHSRQYIFSKELWSQLGGHPNLYVQDGSADAAWT